MIEINLIPDVKREYLRTRALRNFIITISIFVGLGAAAIVVVLSLFFAGQLVLENSLNSNITKQGKELMSVKDLDKAVTLQQQLGQIDDQHNSKKAYSRLFGVVDAVKPQSVKISTLRVSPEDTTLYVEGVAEDGFSALEAFKKTIMNTSIELGSKGDIKEVVLTKEVVGGETNFGEDASGSRVLRFSFSFEYPEELFVASNELLAIKTPTGRVDVTDSKLGVPESLFSNTGEGK